MTLLSIIFFLIVTFGFGSAISFFTKESEDFLERILMRFGIGLGLMLTFGYLLNLLRIPLDWKIFLLISIAILIARVFIDHKKKQLFNVKINFNLYTVIMLVLFTITLYMYAGGAFNYPYLEDDDSWSHALGVKYVAVEKTIFFGQNSPFHYIDPYPPAYDLLIGVIHQTNDSVYWSLKFFNALIISLSVVFFFFFAKVFFNSSKKALYSTFALFAIPAFLSHFIWAIALTMPLFFVSFYAVEKIRHDKRWWIVAALIIMPTITSSPTHSTYFGLFFIIYFIARTLVERRLLIYEFLAGLSSLVLAVILWWTPMAFTHTLRGVADILGPKGGTGALSIGGTGDRVYTLADFLCHSGTPCYNGVNMVNNPIGIGVTISILTVVGIIYLVWRYKNMFKKENYYILVTLLWFVFAFYAVNAAKFPVKLSPFRAWMLLVIPLSLLAGEAINFINSFVKSLINSFTRNNLLKISVPLLVLVLIALGIVIGSFIPKYKVNTANWPPGAFWTSNEEIGGYVWFKDNIPTNSRAFTFSNNAMIIAFDKFTCHWCPDVREFQREGVTQPPEEIYSWLKENQYEYFIVDGQTVQKFGANETNTMLSGLTSNFNLQPVFQNNGIIIFRI